ncbi:MAG: GNAT family N-acetyltransferase [Syntrophomonadaceae bacterium]|jgi:ribosomal protein S18 acetylase RimI-like enzyme|nr:GNAT family N-acetyltransferase [Syntrophomonadaceae bacterium]
MDSGIALAKKSDIPLMLEFWRNTPEIELGGDDEESLAVFIQRNPSTCLIIRNEDGIIGAVLGGFDGRRAFVYHLAVHSDFRGQGYGKKLLDKLITQFKAFKTEKVHLFVLNNNHAAMTFYVKQGWVKRQDIAVFSYNSKK